VSSSTPPIPPASSPTSARFAASLRRPLALALITAWAAGLLYVISTLALPHMAPMAEASRADRTIAALLALREARGRALVVHVIAAHCSCTERLFRHLVERPRFGDAEEIVLFAGVDAAKESQAARAGLRYATVTEDELAKRFALQAAPVMFVFDAGDRLRYAGGYFDHPSALRPLDEPLHTRIARGESTPPLPVYGCAVAPALRDRVDPLGIRDAVR
jgi:thioredoxin-related protein